MSTKMKWVIALFVLQLVAWIGIGISSGMAAIGSIAAAFGMSAFGIAGFVVWHYESIDKLKKQYEDKEKPTIGFVEEKESTSETPAPTPMAEQEEENSALEDDDIDYEVLNKAEEIDYAEYSIFDNPPNKQVLISLFISTFFSLIFLALFLCFLCAPDIFNLTKAAILGFVIFFGILFAIALSCAIYFTIRIKKILHS